jgi:hypothetical protein
VGAHQWHLRGVHVLICWKTSIHLADCIIFLVSNLL